MPWLSRGRGMLGRAVIALAAAALSLSAPGLANAATHEPSAAARDGPFGIAMGEPLSDLGPLEKLGMKFRVVSPPRPSPDIFGVTVEGFPSTGVCMITGISAVNHDDPNAVAAKQIVDQFSDVLATKYGAFTKKIDRCDNNSATCERYLTQAIQDESARYGYIWALKAPRSDHLYAFEVLAHSLDANSTVAEVTYFGDNAETCSAAEKAAASSAF